MRALITQSNYIPWKGYFDNIAKCDVFVVYDNMQYTKRDWRNRNQIKSAQGPKWLTVPVEVKGKFDQTINATRISGQEWKANHLAQLYHAYSKAPHFKEVFPWIEATYAQMDHELLTDLNVHLLRAACERLQIRTRFMDSREFTLAEDRTERLVRICKDVGADEYFTGPASKAYLDETAFEREGVNVSYADYNGYPEYPQLHAPFSHAVCIWDVLLHCGDEARKMVVKQP